MLAMFGDRLTDIEVIVTLEALCVFLALALMLAIAVAFFAIIEMRRMRLALARKDPLWSGADDDAAGAFGGALIARLRNAGGA